MPLGESAQFGVQRLQRLTSRLFWMQPVCSRHGWKRNNYLFPDRHRDHPVSIAGCVGEAVKHSLSELGVDLKPSPLALPGSQLSKLDGG